MGVVGGERRRRPVGGGVGAAGGGVGGGVARAGALAAKYPVSGSPTATLALASAVPAVLVGVASRCSSPRRAPPARTNDELYADLKAAAGTTFVPPLPADVAPARWMAVRGLPAAVLPQRLLLAFPHARRVEAIYAADGARASVMVEVEAAGASLRRSVTPPCSLEPVAAPPLATAGAQRKVSRAASTPSRSSPPPTGARRPRD